MILVNNVPVSDSDAVGMEERERHAKVGDELLLVLRVCRLI